MIMVLEDTLYYIPPDGLSGGNQPRHISDIRKD